MFSWTNLVFEGIFLVFIVIARRQGLSGAEIGALIAAVRACSLARLGCCRRACRSCCRCARSSSRRSGSSSRVAAFLVDPSVYVLLAASLPIGVVRPDRERGRDRLPRRVTPDRLTGRVNSVARTIALLRRAARPARRRLPARRRSRRGRRSRSSRGHRRAARRLRHAALRRSGTRRASTSSQPLEPTEPVVPELVG